MDEARERWVSLPKDSFLLTGCARKNNRINSTHSWLAGSSESLLLATTSDELPPPAASWRRARLWSSQHAHGRGINDEDDEDDTAASVDSSLCLVFSREVFDTVAAEMPVSGSPRVGFAHSARHRRLLFHRQSSNTRFHTARLIFTHFRRDFRDSAQFQPFACHVRGELFLFVSQLQHFLSFEYV